MSKVIPLSPEAIPEKNGDDMIVTLRVSDLKIIMAGVVEAALKRQQPQVQHIVYPLKEAAKMIAVPPTWLAARARAGEITCVRLGHYITFAEKDLKDFADKNRSQLPLPKKKTEKPLDSY